MMLSVSSRTNAPYYEFLLPDLGEGVAEGEVLQWLVSEGDTVEEDQSICEVMTDKVTAEIPAPVAGVLRKQGAKEGEKLAVGAILALIEPSEASTSIAEPLTGAFTAADDKEMREVPSTPSSGLLPAPQPPAPPACGVQAAVMPDENKDKIKTSPAIRQLAKTLDIDLALIQGTGQGGRITREDFEAYRLAALQAECPSAFVSTPTGTPSLQQDSSTQALYQDLPYTGMRRTIGEHLSKSASTIPHFACVEAIRFDALMALRHAMKPLAEAEGVRLSYLPFVLKALAEALRQVPSLNAHFNGSTIRQWHVAHIGVAVATPEGGLVVPVIHDVQAKSIKTLAQELQSLAHAARHGQLQRHQVQGGTFTLTNVGAVGECLFGTPIINAPEVGILAMNTLRKAPMVVSDPHTGQDSVVVGHEMYLTLSADHRVLDGADAVRFLSILKRLLETPQQLLWLT